jgi:uncharacterized protein (DUF305 family)
VNRVAYGIVLLAVLAAGLVASVGSVLGASPAQAPAETADPSRSVAVATASGTDVPWAQLTIALNERALVVLGLVETRVGHPGLKDLSADLEQAYRAENATLRDLLTRIGAPDGNPHTGHIMPGMADEATLQRLTASSGAAFDSLLVDTLDAHMSQCARLAAAEEGAGGDSTAIALAVTIEEARRVERGRLDAVAAALGGGR